MASTCADPSAAAPPRRPRPNSGCRCFAFFCDGPRTFAPPTHCLGMYTHMTVICVCDVTSHCHRAWPQNNPLRTHAYKKRPHARAHAPAPAHSHAPGYDAHARAHAPTRACAYATARTRTAHAPGQAARAQRTHMHPHVRTHAARAHAQHRHTEHTRICPRPCLLHTPALRVAASATLAVPPFRASRQPSAGGGAALPPACRNACARTRAELSRG